MSIVIRVNLRNSQPHHQRDVNAIIKVDALSRHVIRTHQKVIPADLNNLKTTVRQNLLKRRLNITLPSHRLKHPSNLAQYKSRSQGCLAPLNPLKNSFGNLTKSRMSSEGINKNVSIHEPCQRKSSTNFFRTYALATRLGSSSGSRDLTAPNNASVGFP